MNNQIPLAGADITEKEIQAVVDVLKSKRLALGPKLPEFEQAMANFTGTKYALAVNSGTSALHLLIKALGIKAGDEVITSPFSFIASANCALFEGAKPVFVDIDQTLNIDPNKIESAITEKTKAIIAVDIFGQPANWEPILEIAQKYNLKVIEDSCEALGSEYKGRKCGTFGDAGCFAFYPNKQITTCGEGGIIMTNNEELANLCRSMHNQGRAVENGQWLNHVRLGYNYRMTDVQAAMGLVQLERIQELLEKRNKIAQKYNELFKDTPEIITPHIADWVSRMSWFVYVVQLAPQYTREQRDQILQKLRSAGVQCSNYFQCIHLQPFYKQTFGYQEGNFPIAEAVADRAIALPFENALTDEQIYFVAKTLKECL